MKTHLRSLLKRFELWDSVTSCSVVENKAITGHLNDIEFCLLWFPKDRTVCAITDGYINYSVGNDIFHMWSRQLNVSKMLTLGALHSSHLLHKIPREHHLLHHQ